MDRYERIISRVKQPSRYLGCEVNAVKKEEADLKLCLAFPDLYEVGMSHFGMQILYHVVNREPDMLAERVFAPDSDMEALLRAENLPLFSLESRRPLSEFDILGVSLLYELNYTNVLAMLDLAGIPFRAKDRDRRHPFVIAGGPATVNPEPVAAFFDALVVGDGEGVMIEMCRAWLSWKKAGGADRAALLSAWAGIEGVYAPSLFEEEDGSLPEKPRVRRAILPKLSSGLFPDRPLIGFGRPVHDRLRMEIARGCGRGCRFCQAGMIYRPLRERPARDILDLCAKGLSATGYEDLSLLSLSSGDYSRIAELLPALMGRCRGRRVAVSLPSMRAGTLTAGLMEEIGRVRKTGFTIAPEAGSQRLRDVIGKNLTEAEITETVTAAFAAGWRLIKLYFMVGLPTETLEDVEALADLVRGLKKIAGKRADLTASIGIFVPKAHTPFQWAPQLSPEEARGRINFLKDRLRIPGVKVKWQSPETSLLEGVFARGDKRLSGLLERAFRMGARFDGWSDRFDFSLWMQALADEGLDPFEYLAARDVDKPLPWDVVDCRVSREFLVSEWEKAQAGVPGGTSCRAACSGCGVCDFSGIAPEISPPLDSPEAQAPSAAASDAQGSPAALPPNFPGARKLAVRYSRTGPARYFGHLELASVILRALRRCGVPLIYSEGFHPLPKVSFSQALPVLMESEEETLIVSVGPGVSPGTLAGRLSRQLPEGLALIDVAPAQFLEKPDPSRARYEVIFEDFVPDAACLARFRESPAYLVTHENRKGERIELDLKEIVLELTVAENRDADQGLGAESPGNAGSRVEMVLSVLPGRNLKPLAVCRYILGVPEDASVSARVIKKRG